MKAFVMFVCWSLLAAQVARGLDDPPPAPEPRGDTPVDNLYLKAAKAQQDKNYDLAVACWTQVLKINPQDETAFVNRAGIYVAKGEEDKAFADYEEALRLDPKDVTACNYCADLYRTRRMETIMKGAADDPDDTAKAIADYTAALQLRAAGEDQPGKWLAAKARAAEVEHNYELAVAGWSAVLKLDPKNGAAWFRLAVAQAQVLQTDAALADCDKALGIDPGNDDARDFRSQLQAQSKAVEDKDVADLTQKIHAKPGPDTYNQRAQAWMDLGENEKAAGDFREILWLDSNDMTNSRSGAFQRLVSIYGEEGKWEKAMEICDLAARIGPDAADSDHGRRAWIYEGMGDYAKASVESHKDVEDEKKMAKLERDQDAEEKAGEAAEAAEDAREDAEMDAAEGAPHPPKAVPTPTPQSKAEQEEEEEDYNLGICQALIRCCEVDYRAKLYDKALADITEEQKLDPKDDWGKNAMAWLLATCPDAKFRNGAEAIKLAKIGGVGDTLAAAYAEAGKWDEAVAEEKKAIEDDKNEIKKMSDIAAQAAQILPGITPPSAIREQKKKIWQTANTVKDDEEEIKEFEARLALYQQKKPCREVKELDVGD